MYMYKNAQTWSNSAPKYTLIKSVTQRKYIHTQTFGLQKICQFVSKILKMTMYRSIDMLSLFLEQLNAAAINSFSSFVRVCSRGQHCRTVSW